jgi:hypothetical protein
MYSCYRLVLVAEDGEYVISEWQTEERAFKEFDKIKGNYGEGQMLTIRQIARTF